MVELAILYFPNTRIIGFVYSNYIYTYIVLYCPAVIVSFTIYNTLGLKNTLL